MGALILYTTAGCHLCEHAEAILDQVEVQFVPIDIADELELMEKYGIRIPVVRDTGGRELGWPFDATMLRQFLAGDER